MNESKLSGSNVSNITIPTILQIYHKKRKFEIKSSGEDAKKFDYVSLRCTTRAINVRESVGHLVKNCLGGGLMAMQEAYMVCGAWSALMLTAIYTFIISYCMLTLVQSSQKLYGRLHMSTMSYPDLAEAALETGPWERLRPYSKHFRMLVSATMWTELFCTCCVYQVMLACLSKQLVERADSPNTDLITLRIYIVGLTLPCLLLVIISDLKYLMPFSLAANILLIVISLFAIYYSAKNTTTPPEDLPVFRSVAGLFEFTGVCVFSLEAIHIVMAIENIMAKPRKFPLVIAAGMFIVMILIMAVGFFGYWGYGDNVQSPVTMNFTWKPFPLILKVAMAFILFVIYTLSFSTKFQVIWLKLKLHHDPAFFWIWEALYKTVFVLAITVIAVTLPTVSKLMALVSALCFSTIGLIYPAFIQLALDWYHPGLGLLKWRLWKCVFITIFGSVFFFGGIFYNARGLVIEVYLK